MSNLNQGIKDLVCSTPSTIVSSSTNSESTFKSEGDNPYSYNSPPNTDKGDNCALVKMPTDGPKFNASAYIPYCVAKKHIQKVFLFVLFP